MPADRADLRPDCSRCFGLCCVVPAFSVSADFAIAKGAGQPCPQLNPDFRCSIHDRLRQTGFPGCAVYDCFGAGQKIAQVTFGGRDWRQAPETAPQMFAAFSVVRQLHELLWYLDEALRMPSARPLHPELARAYEETETMTHYEPTELVALDGAAHRQAVNALLLRASELIRAGSGGADLRGADLAGKDLTDAKLRGASLRGALLLGTRLRGADLRLADVTGADFRGADLAGANLDTTVFLTQSQLEAATGDRRTHVPPSRTRPTHWQGARSQ